MISYKVFEDFRLATRAQYESIKGTEIQTYIYFHKKNFPEIIVRAPHPKQKIHCWRLYDIEVMQNIPLETKENGRTKMRKKAIISFEGQLISHLIKRFHEQLCRDIIEEVEKYTERLWEWCKEPLDDIFIVQQKIEGKFGFKQGFVEIKSYMLKEGDQQYFERKLWLGSESSDIETIEEEENFYSGIQNYSSLFDLIKTKY